ncbi:MAG: cation:proton antiporter regulatory subunit [Halococcoides sp.]
MTIYETEVPGVGHKFELELDGETRLVVLIHHDGKRELYRREGEADSEKLFGLTGKQARQLGSILEGAHFQPVETDDIQVPLGESIIEWIEVDPDSALAGQTLDAASVRERTGASIIAIQRGEDTIANPSAETRLQADDVIVTLGDREEQAALEDLVASGADT